MNITSVLEAPKSFNFVGN